MDHDSDLSDESAGTGNYELPLHHRWPPLRVAKVIFLQVLSILEAQYLCGGIYLQNSWVTPLPKNREKIECWVIHLQNILVRHPLITKFIPKDKVDVVTGMSVFIPYFSVWNLFFQHRDQPNQSKPFFWTLSSTPALALFSSLWGDYLLVQEVLYTFLDLFDTTYPWRIPQLRGRIYLGGEFMKGGRKSKLAFFSCLQLRGIKLLFSCVLLRGRFFFQLRRRIDLSSKGRQLLITKGNLIKVTGGEV